jgi:hypothetical protein
MKPFFITGLPRSRTAWLANFMTYGGAYCQHEGLLREEQALRWLACGERHGLADSTIPFAWERILERFPSFSLVIVEREPEASFDSLLGFLDRGELRVNRTILHRRFEQLGRALKVMKFTTPHIAVKFEDLSKLETLHRIWEHCVPYPFDMERAEMLQTLNVQQELRAVRAKHFA